MELVMKYVAEPDMPPLRILDDNLMIRRSPFIKGEEIGGTAIFKT
jgi:hypothetical protein